MSPDESFPGDRKGRPRVAGSSDSGEQLVSVDGALGDPPAPSRMQYIGGDVIADKYRLVRKLGEGGMGTVWVAQNQALDMSVAIKLMRGGGDPTRQVGRLTQEARAAAKLGHPAIMRVFDFGTTEGGDPFIVMELLHGESLAAVLERRGNLSETKAVQTILPVVHALVAAHDKGIVHRDLKPENIFLARTDAGGIQPKLVDFGIAKLDRKDFERLTRVGSLLGSPAYMSPEQARGEDVDFSADVWAVSVVLYEMITGAPPFNGHNYNALLWSIIHDEPTPTCTQAGGDAALWAILERGFQKEPTQRWPNMRQLGVALARWLKDRGGHCGRFVADHLAAAAALDCRLLGCKCLAGPGFFSRQPVERPDATSQGSAASYSDQRCARAHADAGRRRGGGRSWARVRGDH
jgi:serine/threonine protein kinase